MFGTLSRRVRHFAMIWAAALCAGAAVLALPSLACASWDMNAQNGANIFFERSEDDTSGAVTCLVYKKDGFPTTYQLNVGSFCATSPSTAFFYSVRTSAQTVTVPANLHSMSVSTDCNYSYLFLFPEIDQRWFLGAGKGVPVVLQNSAGSFITTLPVTAAGSGLPVSVQGTIAADIHSLTDSISVDGTLPVAVASVGGVDSAGLLALLVVAAFGLGIAAYRGVHGA